MSVFHCTNNCHVLHVFLLKFLYEIQVYSRFFLSIMLQLCVSWYSSLPSSYKPLPPMVTPLISPLLLSGHSHQWPLLLSGQSFRWTWIIQFYWPLKRGFLFCEDTFFHFRRRLQYWLIARFVFNKNSSVHNNRQLWEKNDLRYLNFLFLFNFKNLIQYQYIYQGCGNTEMFYLFLGKLSEKNYLSGQNPTCPVFSINIWYLQTQLLNWTCLYCLSHHCIKFEI